ncbi:MAG: nicotinate phosphoribosyltransferase, partial [Candidatus Helarchaeota archaeon]|nr:nicotinate phosphoribosyltransferase [Candidatus Helarchaeota archaeon]
YSYPEGSIIYPTDYNGYRLPYLTIEGNYADFSVLETPLLGLICQASGIATSAARIRKIANNKIILSFGVRRMHPSISPMIDYSCYLAGLDGVSCVLSAELLDVPPSGTIPHALIIVFGDQIEAWKAFDEIISSEVPRIALCDTYRDERDEVVMAAENVENLTGVRLDTPGSRRGNFLKIIKDCRWELDLRGHKDIKIFVSGGIDEERIKKLTIPEVDGFGVGSSLSNAPTIDFGLDIISVFRDGNWEYSAKRDRLNGRKKVWRCQNCVIDLLALEDASPPLCPKCKKEMTSLLIPLIKDGKIVRDIPSPQKIREKLLKYLDKVSID